MLAEKDPAYYQKADIHNPHRLLRALHVTLSSGQPYSSFLGKEKKSPFPYTMIGVYLDPPRESLYQAINARVDEMMAAGLEEEAKGLMAYEQHQALQTVGYAELFRYFKGEITREQAIELIKQNSRRYAKRQVTWFKKFGHGQWFAEPDEEVILAYILDQMKK
jgi:tRNA dimethylallyltransferase